MSTSGEISGEEVESVPPSEETETINETSENGSGLESEAVDEEVSTGSLYMLLLTVALAVVWLGWSGHYELLILSFGIGSIVLTLFLSHSLNIVDSEGQHVNPKLIGYLPWLLIEIVKANIDVIKRVLSPSLPISPTWVRVEAKQRSRFYRVLFANSITLTPGTVSILLSDESILVHAVSKEGAESLLDEGGEMGKKVCSIEL